MPLRSADITGTDITGTDIAGTGTAGGAPPGPRQLASLRSMETVLRAQRPPYLPSSLATVRITPRRALLRIQYPAPCPLGLLGPGS